MYSNARCPVLSAPSPVRFSRASTHATPHAHTPIQTHTLRRDLLSTSHKVSRAHISPIADIPQKALDNRKHHPETPGPFLTQEHYKKGRLSTLPLSPVVKFTETKRAICERRDQPQ